MNFLFDAQMPIRLANGIEIMDQENETGKPIKNHIYHADVECGKGATDADVIKKASQLDAIIVSEDDDFKRIKSNKALIKNLRLGYVLYKPPQHGSRYWEKVLSMMLAWEDLKQKIKKTNKPFVFKIDKKGNIHNEGF